jgi:2-polyprenyl-3-methyl-5-hydroxy-6-metoxy-1,4-benzoquinol methylase
MDGADGRGSRAAPDERYDQHYFQTALGPLPYDRAHSEWLDFFGTIADRIVADIRPRRVLDVGCAKGFLVEALRDRGVEAFGIDVSRYAIGEVRDDITPFCRIASVLDPIDDDYDLITCIEVLEHLDEADGRRAIANICSATRDILFSSTPDDLDEPTHVSVRPRSWWIERFAERDAQLCAEFDAGFIAAHALRFRVGPPTESPIDALLAERARLSTEMAKRDAQIADAGAERDALSRDLTAARRELDAAVREARAAQREIQRLRDTEASLRDEVTSLRDELAARDTALADKAEVARELADLLQNAEDKDQLIAGLNYHLLAVQRTIGWKILERLRRRRDALLPVDSRRWRAYWMVRRPLEVLLDEGVRAFLFKTR